MKSLELWKALRAISLEGKVKALSTCKAGNDAQCVLARYGTVATEESELPIRQVRVRDGFLWYSQQIASGEWWRLKHRIYEELLEKIDAFDVGEARFKLPSRNKLGPPEMVRKCQETHYTAEQNTAVSRRHTEKISAEVAALMKQAATDIRTKIAKTPKKRGLQSALYRAMAQ